MSIANIQDEAKLEVTYPKNIFCLSAHICKDD